MLNFLFCLILIIGVVPGRSANLENCTTPNNEAGQCVPMKLCSIFNNYLQNPNTKFTDEFYQYLNKSVCGYIKYETYICCTARYVFEEDTEVSGTTEKPFLLPKIIPEMDRCGIITSDRIRNGNKTELNEYPWIALLQYQSASGLEFRCTGSLITKRYVLTTANCVQTAHNLVSVRLGEYDLNTDKDCDEEGSYCAPPVQDIGIEEVIPHFDFQGRTFKNDIALIRLNKDANIQEENVKLICLPISKKFETIEHKTATVSGWEYSEESKNLTNKLLQSEIPVLPNSECQNMYKTKITLSNSHICAGGKNYAETCDGSAGAPLFTPVIINETQKIPLFYQIGIVSAGYSKCRELKSYTIFTNVTFYMDWILDNIKS